MTRSPLERLARSADAIAHRLGATLDERSAGLLAGLRAAELADDLDPTTRPDLATATIAVRWKMVAERWPCSGEADQSLRKELAAAAGELLAGLEAERALPAGFATGRTASFLDVRQAPDLAAALASGNGESHAYDVDCRPGDPARTLWIGVAGKRRRILRLRMSAEFYAPTARLVAMPNHEPLLELDAGSRSSLDMPWKASGWCDAPAGAAVGVLHLGPVAAHYHIAALSVLL